MNQPFPGQPYGPPRSFGAPPPPPRGNPILRWGIAIGAFGVCGFCAACVIFGVVLTGGHQGGVRYANTMEAYAIEYLADHRILEPGESVVAYYDATISLDGTEAAVLTNRRVLWHSEVTGTTAIVLEDVTNVRHYSDPVLGIVMDVSSADGRTLHIEIAHLNGGDGFRSELQTRVAQATDGRATVQ
ncbi:MAG: hypothetical protein AAGF12_09785 [Myxococcota bacterium]